MAEGTNTLEKGEYVIGIAIILAALLVSATIYMGMGSIEKAIKGIELSVQSNAGAVEQAVQQQQQALQQAQQQAQQQSGTGDFSFAATDPGIGDNEATVTVIEFSDYQCPYCAVTWGREYGGTNLDDSRGVVKKIMEEYVDTGKVRFVFHAVGYFGQESIDAANAAYCAREIGGDEAYFKMHDKLFIEHTGENEGTFSKANLKAFAAEIGFNGTQMGECIDSGKYDSLVVQKTTEAQIAGIDGTPFYVVNGQALEAGAQPYTYVKAAIEAALKAQS